MSWKYFILLTLATLSLAGIINTRIPVYPKRMASIFDKLLTNEKNFTCSDPQFSQACALVGYDNSFWINGKYKVTSNKHVFLVANFPDFNLDTFAKKHFNQGLYTFASKLKLTNIQIKNTALMMEVGLDVQAARFSTSINLFGFDNIALDFIIAKQSNKTLAAFIGVEFPYNSLSNILNSIVPIDISSVLSTFSGSSFIIELMTDSLSFDNMSDMAPSYLTKYGRFTLAEKGFSVFARIAITQGDNKVCKFLKKILGENAALELLISVQLTSYYGYAGVGSIEFGNGVKITKCGVFFDVSSAPPLKQDFGIVGELLIPMGGAEVRFNGRLIFSLTGVGLGFQMTGIWRKAFTIERFSFGNVNLKGEMAYAGGFPTKLEFGGELAVGKDCYDDSSNFIGSGYCLQGKGYVGINIVEPTSNYFYVSIATLTVDVIMRAFVGSKTEQNIKIPEILQKAIVFPRETLVYYSASGQSLPNLEIPAGVGLSGEILLFGVGAFIDLRFAPSRLYVEAKMNASRINLGGVFVLEGNSSSTGPELYIKLSAHDFVFVGRMYVSLSLFGIRAATFIEFGLYETSFTIIGPLFGGLLTATLQVKLTNSQFENFNFLVAGSIKSDDNMIKLINDVTTFLKEDIGKAKNEIQNKINDVSRAQNDLENKSKSVCQDIRNHCQDKACSAFEDKCEQTEQTNKCTRYENECDRSENVCQEFEKCFLKIPALCKFFNPKCIKNAFKCVAYKAVCKTYETICKVSKKVCKVVDQGIYAACEVGCKTTELAFKTATTALDASKGVLKATQATLGAFAKAADAINNAVQVFYIKNASFSATLNASTKDGFKGALDVDFDIVVFGREYREKLNYNFQNRAESLTKLIELAKKKIKEIFS